MTRDVCMCLTAPSGCLNVVFLVQLELKAPSVAQQDTCPKWAESHKMWKMLHETSLVNPIQSHFSQNPYNPSIHQYCHISRVEWQPVESMPPPRANSALKFQTNQPTNGQGWKNNLPEVGNLKKLNLWHNKHHLPSSHSFCLFKHSSDGTNVCNPFPNATFASPSPVRVLLWRAHTQDLPLSGMKGR